MAQIFRVERTKNFTVMSNHHFKNKNLTLKAKGLLSLMLSLPDDWNYNMQGLATLSRDGIDSVRSAIKELEHHGYVDVGTLNILSKKKENVAVTVYTLQRTKLSQRDIDNFNAQYPKLDVKYTRAFHDRFLILDKTKAYHVGASLKDAGKKCFGINLIEDAGIVRDILQRLELETEE